MGRGGPPRHGRQRACGPPGTAGGPVSSTRRGKGKTAGPRPWRRHGAHVAAVRALRPLRKEGKKTEAVGQLVPLGSNALLRFHLRPIHVVVSHGPPPDKSGWNAHLGAGFALRCFQRLSVPHVATQRCAWRHNWHTSGASVPVLSYWGRPPSAFPRPPQIETELSYDVLNPARVPL